MIEDQIAALESILLGDSNVKARDWLNSAREQLMNAEDIGLELSSLSAMARRAVAPDVLLIDSDTQIAPASLPGISTWLLSEGVRVLLSLWATRFTDGSAAALISELYRSGDESERVAVVKGLFLLPSAATDLKPLALEAGRINSLTLFSALALNNSYPNLYYTDHEFNQLVLKSLFNMLPIQNVLGLTERGNPDLSRMCSDYVQERINAGRTVQTNIWLALTPCANAKGEEFINRYLDDEDSNHRYFCALALSVAQSISPALKIKLNQCNEKESDANVLSVLKLAVRAAG